MASSGKFQTALISILFMIQMGYLSAEKMGGEAAGFGDSATKQTPKADMAMDEKKMNPSESKVDGEDEKKMNPSESKVDGEDEKKMNPSESKDDGEDEKKMNPSESKVDGEDEKKMNSSESKEVDEEKDGMPTEDDFVAYAVYQLRETPINRDHIPALTYKTFPQETASRDVLMVLFYFRSDSRSMAFMRSYSEAAESLAKDGIEPLAALECWDWTDVCAKENITSYPTIRIYQKGRGYMVYDGPLESKAVMKKIKLLVSPAPVHLQTEDEVSKFIEGAFPSAMSTVTPVSVLGLFAKEHTAELQAFKDASLALHGMQLMGHAADELTEKLLKSYSMNSPGFVVFNREDPYKPHRVSEGAMNVDEIMTKISDAVLPVLPQLTAFNFPTYFAMGQPLVVLFNQEAGADQDKEIMKTMSELALDKGNLKVVYCWLPVDDKDPDDVGMNVLLDYHSAAVVPALSIVHHVLGNIYNYPNTSNFEKENILQWVKSVLDGGIKPSKMLKDREWKPIMSDYDFLNKIDLEAAEKKNRSMGKDSDESEMDDLEDDENMDSDESEEDPLDDENMDFEIKIHPEHDEKNMGNDTAAQHDENMGNDTATQHDDDNIAKRHDMAKQHENGMAARQDEDMTARHVDDMTKRHDDDDIAKQLDDDLAARHHDYRTARHDDDMATQHDDMAKRHDDEMATQHDDDMATQHDGIAKRHDDDMAASYDEGPHKEL